MSKFARNMSILIVAIMLGVALASCGTTTPVATEVPVEPTTPVVAPVEPTEEEVTEWFLKSSHLARIFPPSQPLPPR